MRAVRRLFFVTVFVATLATILACASAEERADAARERFREALGRGDRIEALAAIDDLRSSLPDAPETLIEVAQLQVQAGSAPDAGWLLEEAVRRFPERANVRVASGRVALLLGNPALARASVLPIGADAEEHPVALVVRAQAELEMGDLNAALATLAETEKLYPERPEARLLRIATLLKEHRRDEARAAIDEARAALAGDDEESQGIRRRLDLTLAQIEAAQGEPDAAIAMLETMLASQPEDLLVWRQLMQMLIQRERGEEALARVEQALEAEDAPVGLYALAADLYVALDRETEAEAALRRFVAHSDSAAAYLPWVTFHSVRDDADATVAVLEEAISRYPDEPTLRLLHTEALLAREQLEAARSELDRFRDLTFDDDPQIDYLIARVELAEGDAAAAAERLRALAPRLDRAATQYWLGRALEVLGDGAGARRRYGLAMQRDPQWVAPAAALLSLEQRRGDWRSVVARSQHLVTLAPDRIEGWLALVEALENLGEGEAAERAATACVERFPDRPEPLLLRARALRAQRRHDEALAALDAAEAGGAAPIPIEAQRILTLGMAGRVDDGVAHARQALARHPDAAPLHAALAALLFAAGAAEEGARATDRALDLDPAEPWPWRVRCEFRAASGRWAGAVEDCTSYLAARPDDAGAHFMLGVARQSLGESAPAALAYRRAAALDERDSRPLNNLAELLSAQGDLDGALAVAQEAYRLDAADPYVMDTLGALYLRKGLADRAVSILEEAHAAAPELPDAVLHLALAYRDTGRTDEARVLLVGLDANGGANEALRVAAREALHSLP